MKVITFSRFFPAYHPRKGEPTFFVEKIWKQLHTDNFRDGEYTIWSKNPRQMKDGHWQLPHLWRDKMNDDNFYPKYHTIRAGNRWKVGDYFSPRVWSDKPYRSKQIEIAPPIQIKKIWNVDIELGNYLQVMLPTKSNTTWKLLSNGEVAKNDGLDVHDFMNWFNIYPKKKKDMFKGQIICWNENINY